VAPLGGGVLNDARPSHGGMSSHTTKGAGTGEKIYEQIESAIQVFDRLLLVLSSASMASDWVATEVAHARKRESRECRQILFPISLVAFEEIRHWQSFHADTGQDVGRAVRTYFIPDFSGWRDPVQFERALARILRDLRSTDVPPVQKPDAQRPWACR